jgi:hypothetical protein
MDTSTGTFTSGAAETPGGKNTYFRKLINSGKELSSITDSHKSFIISFLAQTQNKNCTLALKANAPALSLGLLYHFVKRFDSAIVYLEKVASLLRAVPVFIICVPASGD